MPPSIRSQRSSSYPIGARTDRVGRRNLLLAGLGALCVSYLGFATSQQAMVIAILFAGYGIYPGVLGAVGKSLAADLVPQELWASGIGWYNSSRDSANSSRVLSRGCFGTMPVIMHRSSTAPSSRSLVLSP